MSSQQIEQGNRALEEHVRDKFTGHEVSVEVWNTGPIVEAVSKYKVLKIGPGPNIGLWAYVSIGSWQLFDDSSLEFLILAADENDIYVERLAMTTYYHSLHRLGKGHTFPVGEPWVPGSTCESCLVSPPYPLGPEFEVCDLTNEHVHFLWLLPIMEKERAFKIEHRLDALEEKFEEKSLKYWDAFRESLV